MSGLRHTHSVNSFLVGLAVAAVVVATATGAYAQSTVTHGSGFSWAVASSMWGAGAKSGGSTETELVDFEDGTMSGWSYPPDTIWPVGGLTERDAFAVVSPGLRGSAYRLQGTDAAVSPNVFLDAGVVEFYTQLDSAHSRLMIALAVLDKRNWVLVNLGCVGDSTETDSIQLVVDDRRVYHFQTPSRMNPRSTHHVQIIREPGLVDLYIDGSRVLALESDRIPDGPLPFFFVAQGKASLDSARVPVRLPTLLVTPASRAVESFESTVNFVISNSRDGEFNWSAEVTEGEDWLTLLSAASGVNTGVLEALCVENTSDSARTGSITVTAPEAVNSPVVVTITQSTSRVPALTVLPASAALPSGSGAVTFSVQNSGVGSMAWTASVVGTVGWMRLVSGAAGTNDGAISLEYDANPSEFERTAILRVTAPNADGSPRDIHITQLGSASAQPVLSVSPATQTVSAESGAALFTIENLGQGEMDWSAEIVVGESWLGIAAVETGANPGFLELAYDENPSTGSRTATVTIAATGAANSPTSITVVQQGRSGGTGGDGGTCALTVQRLDTKVAERALPLSVDAAADGAVAPHLPLAIRLTADAPIDPATVWATLETPDGLAEGGKWRPSTEGDDRDGWVVFSPREMLPADTVVALTVGALTVDGEAVGPVTEQFRSSAAKSLSAIECTLYIRQESEIAPLSSLLAAAASPVWRVGPPAVFDEPVPVLIPVPKGVDPDDLDIFYYSEDAQHAGWYRGENVAGWLVPGTRRIVKEDGRVFIEIDVNHGGVVQLGRSVKVSLGGAGVVDVGATGSPLRWAALLAAVSALAFLLVRSARREAADE